MWSVSYLFRRRGRKVRRKANAEDGAFFATAVKVCSYFDVEYPQPFFFSLRRPLEWNPNVVEILVYCLYATSMCLSKNEETSSLQP